MIQLLKKNIKSIILILLLCLCIFLVYEKNNKENFNENCTKSKFIFLYIDGCKYCDDLKKLWNPNGLPAEFQKELKKHHSLKNKVELYAYKDNHDEHKKRLGHIKRSGGYPTLLLEKCNGKTKIHNGPRDTKSLISWLINNA
jgi:thioredoxin-related protein|tara:strand:+ start:670 stop:1095 length:426 start_codon:yes stop_codon:yes gene_type:complete